MSHHFISDLHLSEDTPALCQLFVDTLQQWQGQIDSLFILGDLFEYWVGDDDDSAFLQDMLAAMQQFSRHTPLYVMRGNRDFLLGGLFPAQRRHLLEDPTCWKPMVTAICSAMAMRCVPRHRLSAIQAMSRTRPGKPPCWQDHWPSATPLQRRPACKAKRPNSSKA
jgi:UDP-2,3-diacylglucosamine hydrolase